MGSVGERDGGAGVGCLLALAGAGTGLVTWLHGARPGLRGGFEGEGRNLSLLYVELPAMVLGVPAVALAVWALTRALLGDRLTPAARASTSAVAGLTALTLLGWACITWLDHATGSAVPTTPL
ncbi:hypothetical protein QNO07_03020 [Streptomyces sp. 549]|uniref:hypothetical protein n=1 Tax=Streptomyces sp. 549 TaxID=3049076 RepID=UPI0024C22010|nr:hypothetical protein [Streptomyces sp. 549]MDK1472406.1 hypothetical protein [Streptomyces sp. 549]